MKMKKKDIVFLCFLGTLLLLIIALIILLIFILKGNTIYETAESSAISSLDVSSITSEVSSNTSTSIPSKNQTTSVQSSNTVTSSKIPSSTPSSKTENSSLVSSENEEKINTAEQLWFNQIYSLAETQYKIEIGNKINTYSNELSQWEEKSREYSAQKLIDEANIRENYANMGLLDSGAYQQAISNLSSKYRGLQSECDNNIKSLRSEISVLNEEKNNPDTNQILALIARSNNLTASQVVEYYNKYIQ